MKRSLILAAATAALLFASMPAMAQTPTAKPCKPDDSRPKCIYERIEALEKKLSQRVEGLEKNLSTLDSQAIKQGPAYFIQTSDGYACFVVGADKTFIPCPPRDGNAMSPGFLFKFERLK